MKKKRVAFITEFIPPYRKSFYRKLVDFSNFDWKILYGIKGKEDGRPGYDGNFEFDNYPVPIKEGKIGSFNIRWQYGVIEKVKLWQPDIIITQGIPSILSYWPALIWARQHGAKSITWHCGWEEQAGNRLSLPIKKWIAKIFLSLADHILAYSTKGAAYLIELQGGRSDNISICFNGIDVDPLLDNEIEYRNKGKALRQEYKVTGKKIFLYVGGMMAEKHVPLLLEAFNLLKEENVILWLVGDGPEMPKIRTLAETLRIKNIKFWGRLFQDVDVFFAAADYFVLPGVGGLALNQALFWGLPCVVSEADGTEDDLVFDNKTGFRFIPNDVISLKNAMERCINLPDEIKDKFAETGRDLILKRSNVNVMVKTFIKTIQKISD